MEMWNQAGYTYTKRDWLTSGSSFFPLNSIIVLHSVSNAFSFISLVLEKKKNLMLGSNYCSALLPYSANSMTFKVRTVINGIRRVIELYRGV